MIKIKISTASKEHYLIKQTPGSKGIWRNCEFHVNEDIEDCDFWIVYDGISNQEKTKCPKNNTILITGEPPSIKKYNQKFLKQFAFVITCHEDIKHHNKIQMQQALPWWIGYKFTENFTAIEKNNPDNKSYDELKKMPEVKKEKLLSIIVSDKHMTEGHAKRLVFLKELKESFGDKIDMFGRGINEVQDKWDAISPYKFHIVLENCSHKNYWTEKLTDTILSLSYPIYYGCPNINDYLPKDSLTTIDIDDPQKSINIINNLINNNQYEKSIEKIKEAKNLILDKYNLFPMMHDFCNNHYSIKSVKKKIIIYPESSYNSFLNKVKKILKLYVYY